MDLTWDINPSNHYNFIVSNLISYSYILFHYLLYNIAESIFEQKLFELTEFKKVHGKSKWN